MLIPVQVRVSLSFLKLEDCWEEDSCVFHQPHEINGKMDFKTSHSNYRPVSVPSLRIRIGHAVCACLAQSSESKRISSLGLYMNTSWAPGVCILSASFLQALPSLSDWSAKLALSGNWWLEDNAGNPSVRWASSCACSSAYFKIFTCISSSWTCQSCDSRRFFRSSISFAWHWDDGFPWIMLVWKNIICKNTKVSSWTNGP